MKGIPKKKLSLILAENSQLDERKGSGIRLTFAEFMLHHFCVPLGKCQNVPGSDCEESWNHNVMG